MDRRDFVAAATAAALTAPAKLLANTAPTPTHNTRMQPTKRILIAGGGFNTKYIAYMAQLSGKPRARVCYLPTASADSPQSALGFYKACAPLNVEPFVQNMYIESLSQTQGFDEVLLSMDAIVVSGGNTLNQQAIWKAQGVDVILRQAWEKGIVLGGASAGSLCWFEEGTTDSRPKALSIVKCLGFLPGSHSPHYDAEAGRRPLYHKLIGSGEMKPGYACDNDAGMLFEGTNVKRVVSTRAEAKVYHVTLENGKVVEHVLQPQML